MPISCLEVFNDEVMYCRANEEISAFTSPEISNIRLLDREAKFVEFHSKPFIKNTVDMFIPGYSNSEIDFLSIDGFLLNINFDALQKRFSLEVVDGKRFVSGTIGKLQFEPGTDIDELPQRIRSKLLMSLSCTLFLMRPIQKNKEEVEEK